MRSPTHQERPSSPPRAAIRFRSESSQQGRHFTPSWTPSSSNPPRPIYDDNGVMWVPYQQSFHLVWGGPRKPALDRIARLVQDCWAPRQFGQGHQANPVRPPPTRGQTAPPKKLCNLLQNKCTSPRLEKRRFRRWILTQKELLTETSFRLGQWVFLLRNIAKNQLS